MGKFLQIKGLKQGATKLVCHDSLKKYFVVDYSINLNSFVIDKIKGRFKMETKAYFLNHWEYKQCLFSSYLVEWNQVFSQTCFSQDYKIIEFRKIRGKSYKSEMMEIESTHKLGLSSKRIL